MAQLSKSGQTDTQAKILISYLGFRASVIEHRVGFAVGGMIAEVRELTEDIHVPDASTFPMKEPDALAPHNQPFSVSRGTPPKVSR